VALSGLLHGVEIRRGDLQGDCFQRLVGLSSPSDQVLDLGHELLLDESNDGVVADCQRAHDAAECASGVGDEIGKAKDAPCQQRLAGLFRDGVVGSAYDRPGLDAIDIGAVDAPG